MKNINIKVYDCGPDSTKDRYTVIIGSDAFGLSDDALSPQGFNMWIGDAADIKPEALGEEISIRDLPVEVGAAIHRRLEAFKK